MCKEEEMVLQTKDLLLALVVSLAPAQYVMQLSKKKEELLYLTQKVVMK
jgi:hypothetical protein